MNIPTIVIGLAALLFGVYIIYVRSTDPGKLAKLKAMQDNLGDKRGSLTHLLFYSIFPIIVGIILLLTGLLGVSVF